MGIEITCDACCGDMSNDEVICAKCVKKTSMRAAEAAPDTLEDEVGDLAAAIRRGDLGEAEYLLDKIAAQVPGWADRVSVARYSSLARAA